MLCDSLLPFAPPQSRRAFQFLILTRCCPRCTAPRQCQRLPSAARLMTWDFRHAKLRYRTPLGPITKHVAGSSPCNNIQARPCFPSSYGTCTVLYLVIQGPGTTAKSKSSRLTRVTTLNSHCCSPRHSRRVINYLASPTCLCIGVPGKSTYCDGTTWRHLRTKTAQTCGASLARHRIPEAPRAPCRQHSETSSIVRSSSFSPTPTART